MFVSHGFCHCLTSCLCSSMGEVNVRTNYDRLFWIKTKVQSGPIFHKLHILWTFRTNFHFSDMQIRRKFALFKTCLSQWHTLRRSGASLLSSQIKMNSNIRHKHYICSICSVVLFWHGQAIVHQQCDRNGHGLMYIWLRKSCKHECLRLNSTNNTRKLPQPIWKYPWNYQCTVQ